MKYPYKILPALTILLMLAACNLPSLQVNQNLSPNDQAATIVAMTLQAGGLPTSQGAIPTTPFASPAAATPTVAKPLLFINNSDTKCRSGPGPNFKVVATFGSGVTVEMVGKDTADSYWLVKDPGSAEDCWVQAQNGTPSGGFDTLPEVTPQAVSQGAPARPGSIIYNFSCDNSSLTTSLSRADSADNENGYHVFRLGNQIADLPANSTSYSDTVNYTLGTQMTYSIEAYNDAGVSEQRSITFTCPP